MRLTVLLAVASFAVALVGAELALRRAHPLWAIPYPPVCYRPDLFQRWDPYGYRLWPSRIPLAVGTSASAAGVRAIPEAYPRASGTLTLY